MATVLVSLLLVNFISPILCFPESSSLGIVSSSLAVADAPATKVSRTPIIFALYLALTATSSARSWSSDCRLPLFRIGTSTLTVVLRSTLSTLMSLTSILEACSSITR